MVTTILSIGQDMRRFWIKCAIFVLLAVPLAYVPLLFKNRVADDVYECIERSHEPASAPLLVLGDSLARQLFHRRDEVPGVRRHITSNGAISMVGQYILAKNAIAHMTNLQVLCLMLHPISLQNDLDQVYTMNYFVKPFLGSGQTREFSPLVWKRLNSHPVYRLAWWPPLRQSMILSKVDYSDGAGFVVKPNQVSAISLEYLVRLRDLARRHGVTLRVISPPLSRGGDLDFTHMRRQLWEAGLGDLFREYFENLTLMDPDLFQDRIHLRKEALPSVKVDYAQRVDALLP